MKNKFNLTEIQDRCKLTKIKENIFPLLDNMVTINAENEFYSIYIQMFPDKDDSKPVINVEAKNMSCFCFKMYCDGTAHIDATKCFQFEIGTDVLMEEAIEGVIIAKTTVEYIYDFIQKRMTKSE